MKKFLMILSIGFVLMFAAACEEDAEPVAIVNDEEILEKEYELMVDQMKQPYKQQGMDFEGEQGEMMLEQIESMALETLIQQEVIIQQAEADGHSVSDEEIDEKFEEAKAGFQTEEDFEEALEENNYTEETFRSFLADELLIEAYLDAEIDEVEISDEDIEEAYEEYKKNMEEHEDDPEPLEEIEDKLEEQIIQQKEQELINEHVEGIKEDSDIERLIND